MTIPNHRDNTSYLPNLEHFGDLDQYHMPALCASGLATQLPIHSFFQPSTSSRPSNQTEVFWVFLKFGYFFRKLSGNTVPDSASEPQLWLHLGSISWLKLRRSLYFFARICGVKVGHQRMVQLDRAISMDFAERKTYKKSTPGFYHRGTTEENSKFSIFGMVVMPFQCRGVYF